MLSPVAPPQVVVVDARSASGSDGGMRFSRGARDYANWFLCFNHLRDPLGSASPGR
jgi:hypothetical protein